MISFPHPTAHLGAQNTLRIVEEFVWGSTPHGAIDRTEECFFVGICRAGGKVRFFVSFRAIFLNTFITRQTNQINPQSMIPWRRLLRDPLRRTQLLDLVPEALHFGTQLLSPARHARDQRLRRRRRQCWFWRDVTWNSTHQRGLRGDE
jgi:hypothetical protein